MGTFIRTLSTSVATNPILLIGTAALGIGVYFFQNSQRGQITVGTDGISISYEKE